MHRSIPHKEPMIPHDIPSIPFYKVGVDLFQVGNENYMVFIDYYSKYPEVVKMTQTTSQSIIEAMKEMFARHGIPKTVVSDNGPQFSSDEYRCFAKLFGFTPKYSSPMYPRSNGEAERSVQTMKSMIKKAKADRTDFQIALLNFRNTTIYELGASPAQILMSRRFRCTLPARTCQLSPKVIPSRDRQMKEMKIRQKTYYDKHAGSGHRVFRVGEPVRYLNQRQEWKKGTIISANAAHRRDYTLRNEEDREIRRNRTHIISARGPREEKRTINPPHSTVRNGPENISYNTRFGRQVKPVHRLGY